MRWVVCAGADEEPGIVDAVSGLAGCEEVRTIADPVRAREELLGAPAGEASCAVGEHVEGIAPVNLAAAIAADGHAAEVLLLVEDPSGSLRSRARGAGVAVLPKPRAAHGEDGGPDAAASAQASFSSALARADAALADRAPVIAIASGRGGVGKTVLASLMGSMASQWGMRCALVDADLCSGDLFSRFGLEGGTDLARLASCPDVTPKDVESVSVRVAEGLTLLGPCSRPELAETLGWRFGRMLQTLASENDLVVVDCSTTVTDAVAQALQASDRVLLVGDELRGAVGSLARVAALCVRLGVPRTRIVRVMARCDERKGDEREYRAAIGLETARSFRMPEGGSDVSELMLSGRALELAESGGELAASVAGCLATLLSELGRLPDSPQAERALKRSEPRRRRGLFRRAREAS